MKEKNLVITSQFQKIYKAVHIGIDVQKLYKTGSDWTSDRYIYLYQGPTILINSINAILNGLQLRIKTNIDILA